MRAGELRHRINIDQPVTSQDETGEEIVTFTEMGTVWGAIEPLNGREALIANQLNAEIDTRIRVRWSPLTDQITAKWRLRHRDTVFNIKQPPAQVNMEQREIHIICETGLNNG